MERSSRKIQNKEEWKQLGLIEKWNQSYSGGYVDTHTVKVTESGFSILFLFTNVVNIYCFLCHVIPEYLSDYSATTRTIFAVLALFIQAHIITHWYFTRNHKSYVKMDNIDELPNVDQVQNSDHCVDIGNAMTHKKSCSLSKCDKCQTIRPLRAHHCKICDICILKRDHHCFLTGVCIGFRNQRHFIVMSFYSGIASVAGLVFACQYLSSHLGPQFTSAWDYFLPYIFYKWITGQILLQHLLFCFLIYIFSWFSFMSVGFFVTQMFCTAIGKTFFELKKGLKVPYTNSIKNNIRSVFGDYWALNFAFPMHVWFPQSGDGMNWIEDYKDS